MVIIIAVCAVIFWHVVPAVLFTSYLIYGGIRPWISRKWRREIEEDVDDPEVEILDKVDDENESAA